MALSRINSQSIADGTVIASDIADGTVTNTKLAGSITSDKITSVSNTAISGLIQAAQIGSANASVIDAGTLAKARLPTGSVLQVLSTPKTDTFSTASLSFVDITGLSVAITPSAASSKILIIVGLSLGATAGSFSAQPRLMRDSTAIFVGDAAGSRTQAAMMYEAAAAASIPGSIVFLDSPATTSATTYKMQLRSNNGSFNVYVNRGVTDTDASAFARTVSSITVMEIAA
jgi:hypothetical protein